MLLPSGLVVAAAGTVAAVGGTGKLRCCGCACWVPRSLKQREQRRH